MKLLVVGAGEMGRWLAESLATHLDESPDVAFADTDPDAAARAVEAVGGRTVPPASEERFDLVCLAVPIPAVESAIEMYADRADRAMIDVSGVMGRPVAAMAASTPTVERLSLHPLFAAANAPGSIAAVVDAPGPVADRVRAALEAAGNEVFETTPAKHDRAMETVQTKAHAAILAFGLAADDVPEGFQTPISDGLFDLLAEMTGNDPSVYSDIQATFDGSDEIADAARRLAAADAEEFERLYRAANPRTDERGYEATGFNSETADPDR